VRPGEIAGLARTVRMFVNGQAMSGGSLHETLRSGRLIEAVRTAPRYQFWSVRDEFPALQPVASDGWDVPGELYEISLAALRTDLLPREPPELELTVIELGDGTDALSMRLRPGLEGGPGLVRITEPGGWRTYVGKVVAG
jgi:gamma-glutamylcyclotransferase (GGCT)/AIG2-like uncharacterized protein YtfP